MSRENPDYFKVGGRSGGPVGPLDRFKSEVSRSRARLEREAHRPRRGAVREVEQQLADLHEGGPHHRSVLDDLPRAQGPAGVPAGRKPADPHLEPMETHAARAQSDGGSMSEGATLDDDGRVPADYAVAEREAAPWADRDAAGGRTGPRLSPVQHRAVRLILPPLRLLAGAVHLAEKAVRRAYDGLMSLERGAREGA